MKKPEKNLDAASPHLGFRLQRRRRRVSFVSTLPSMTKQAFKDECDINNILRSYAKTGVFKQAVAEGVFEDFSEPQDLQQAMNTVIAAQSQFEALPAALRKRFGNDPVEFCAFASDPANASEMVKMGLATLREQPPTSTPRQPSSAAPEAGQARKGAKGGQPAKAGTEPASHPHPGDEDL